MAFVPVPNTAEVEIVCDYLGQVVENTLYFNKGTPYAAGDLDDLLTAVDGWFSVNVLPNLNPSVVVNHYKATSLESDSAPTATLVPAVAETGADAEGDPLPGNVTITISFKSNGRGRSSRGRNYIFGLPGGRISGNQIDPTWVGAVRLGYVQLPLTAGLGDNVHVVVSRFHLGAPRITGVTLPVTAYVVVDNNLDSQRRRLAGRGT